MIKRVRIRQHDNKVIGALMCLWNCRPQRKNNNCFYETLNPAEIKKTITKLQEKSPIKNPRQRISGAGFGDKLTRMSSSKIRKKTG